MYRPIQFLVLMLLASQMLAQPVFGPPSCRDVRTWPYSQNSIWNIPIRTGAQYHPQPVSPSHIDGIQADLDIIILTPDAPKMNIYGTKYRWQGGTNPTTRCERYNDFIHLSMPIPENYVTLFYKQERPNNAGIIMDENGRTLVQVQPFQSCGTYATSGLKNSNGSPINELIRTPDIDIYGDGRRGMHGGSGLNTMGGAIRLGELISPNIDAMRHALKISFPGEQYLYFNSSTNKGYRWPAVKHDSGAKKFYLSNNPEAQIGCLRALKPDLDINSLGLETLAGKKLAWTLQNYGAYQVEGVPWQRMMIAVEEGPNGSVVEEFLDTYGWEFVSKDKANNPWVKDCLKIIQHLYIVKNHTEDTPGGGGSPLQPLAPDFCGGTGENLLGTAAKINFQPRTSQVPNGYLVDAGDVYSNRPSGLTYGWLSESNTSKASERDSNIDLRLKTLNHFKNRSQRTWGIAVENGQWDLVLSCGEPRFSDQINNLDIEGVIVNDPDGSDNFDEYTLRVTVTDNQLTIKQAPGGNNAKINYIDLTPVNLNPGTKYQLSVNSGIGDGQYAAGNIVNIVADAAPTGMVFDRWTGDVSTVANVNASSTSITMPANPTTITATYREQVIVTYQLTVSNGSGSGSYEEGAAVSIQADAAPSGMVFDQWTGDVSTVADVSSAMTTVSIPNNSVSVSATYTSAPVGGEVVAMINFQPGGASTPSGYVVDDGDAYGNRGNGFFYGWLGNRNNKTRQRSGGAEAKLRTLNHMRNGSDRVWEFGLTNGTYQLEIGCGDAQYSDQINTIDVEGTVINDPDGQDNFDIYDVTVTVTDGKLTIQPASGSSNPKICYIDIRTSGGITPPPPPMEYTVTVVNGTGDGSYEECSIVNIVANPAPAGQEFDMWSGDIAQVADASSSVTTLTVLNADITVMATYKDLPQDDCPSVNFSIEAEANGNTMNGTTRTNNKSAASGGVVVGYLGRNSNNYLIINNINVPCTDDYRVEVDYISGSTRTIFLSANNSGSTSQSVNSGGWNKVSSFTKTMMLNEGSNSIKFFNNNGKSPDIDKITITSINGNSREIALSNDAEPMMQVYPNPSNGILNVSLVGFSQGQKKISILDFQGKVLREVKTTQRSIHFDQKYNLGVYLIKVEADGRSLLKKVVVK